MSWVKADQNCDTEYYLEKSGLGFSQNIKENTHVHLHKNDLTLARAWSDTEFGQQEIKSYFHTGMVSI